nr:acyltransferase [Desulfobacula sp.]
MQLLDYKENNYIEGFYGLRAVACMGVFMVHFQQITGLNIQWKGFDFSLLMKNGNTGVALFFILSGFLLSQPFWLNKIHAEKKIGLWKYAIKRIGRILPAYYVCLTGLIIVQQRWDHSHAAGDILLHYLFLHNFSEQSIYSLNPPFWTLAVEMQFYLLLPIFFYFTRWFRPFFTCLIFFFLGAASYGIHLVVMNLASGIAQWPFNHDILSPHGHVLERSILAHMPLFMLGIAAGWLYIKKKISNGGNKTPSVKNDMIVLLCFATTLIILGTGLDDMLTLPYGRYHYPYIPLLLAVIVLYISFSAVSRLFLESRFIKFIGIISYGIYIYHLPIQRFTEKMMTKGGVNIESNWMLFGVTAFMVSIVVAGFSYYTLESFSLNIIRRYQ